ncbi:MAG: hypothetical protein M3R59_07195 [Verrucomicrobiota bacterium]|nr:hypothetical protein [Verrucomicrobiota bacterium]
MRRSAIVIALLVGVCLAVLAWRFRAQTTTVATTSAPAWTSIPPSTPAPEIASANVPSPAATPIPSASVAPNALSLEQTGHDAAALRAGAKDTHMLGVKMALRDYRAAIGENPVGTNSEITAALLGRNARGATFTAESFPRDGEGNLLDRWDHPYFFHQLSRSQMEIRSAGPDGVMWTADDELIR